MAFYVAEMAQAINSMHVLRVLHRDLKPDNFMVTLQGHLKVTDFGVSTYMEAEHYNQNVGTMRYSSPEMLKNDNYAYPTDFWSIGIILFEMAARQHPCGEGSMNMETYIKATENISFRLISEDHGLRDLVQKLLQVRPADRANFEDVKNHPYLDCINWSQIETLSYFPPYTPGRFESKFDTQFENSSRFNPRLSTFGEGALNLEDFDCEFPDPQPNKCSQYNLLDIESDEEENNAYDFEIQEKINRWIRTQRIEQNEMVIVRNGKVFCPFGDCRLAPPLKAQTKLQIGNYQQHFLNAHLFRK